MANETVNYDTEIKAYQFDLVSSDKRTGLTGVFEGVWSLVWCNCQWYIPKSIEKKYFKGRKSRGKYISIHPVPFSSCDI